MYFCRNTPVTHRHYWIYFRCASTCLNVSAGKSAGVGLWGSMVAALSSGGIARQMRSPPLQVWLPFSLPQVQEDRLLRSTNRIIHTRRVRIYHPWQNTQVLARGPYVVLCPSRSQLKRQSAFIVNRKSDCVERAAFIRRADAAQLRGNDGRGTVRARIPVMQRVR